MIVMLIIMVMLFVGVGWLWTRGAGRNRRDPDGRMVPLDVFDIPIETNRAARRARE